jgi:hypothetical protein
MALSQRDISTAALTAALFVQDKSKEELSNFVWKLSVPENRQESVKSLCEMLANSRGEKVEDVNVELAEEILRRILTNIGLRYGESSFT